MLADPDINAAVFRNPDARPARFYAREVCDPCAAYEDGYETGGRWVTDFVWPSWFQSNACRRHPAGGLAYSAVLPVDLRTVRRSCERPRVARVRAVLSWSVPPSTSDPDAVPFWGNRLDAHVQVRPGEEPPEGGAIAIIGGVGIGHIDVGAAGTTLPDAVFALGGAPADQWQLGRECPFGGLILVQGPPVPGSKYRLWARLAGRPNTEAVVTNAISVYDTTAGQQKTYHPQPGTGYLDYLPVANNFDQVLAHWTPAGDDLWEIRLEVADAA